jgi:predicted DsbA family dithiol-disulfide isomerase
MRVDIWSDVVCPWCYVGKARFERALAAHPQGAGAEVVYHAFELDSSYPRGRRDETNLGLLARKYGLPPERALLAEGQVAGLARAEGLGFNTERPIGNTFDIHRVIRLGLAEGVQRELVGAVNQAYFAEARQVFDPAVLTQVAVGAGLSEADVSRVLDGDGYADDVRQDEAQARQLGIGGVPFFVFDQRVGVSGAQSAERFTQVLDQAAGASA